jgi:hypothetical protein
MTRHAVFAGVAVAALLGSFACAAGPRSRPIPTTEIDKGTGTLQNARKFLEGRWTLMSFQVFPANAEPIMVPGSGVMTYDDFGNLRMEIRAEQAVADRLEGVGIMMQQGVISSEGRTTLDLVRKTLTYVLEGQPPAGAPVGPLATSRPRYWEVDGDVLTLSTKDDSGRTLSIGKWKKGT